jgi:prepilin-type N-terminal cleavage/methylation domain-containing protein
LPGPEHRRDGFTLLEVMAAVALLGIVCAILGRAAFESLAREGEAQRRIQASLLADSVLSDIEMGLDQGTSPKVGDEERDSGDFKVAIHVAPFDLEVPEEKPRTGEPTVSRDRRPGESLRGGQNLGPSLLVGANGKPSPLRRVDVKVTWLEGWGERSVERTTFGLDNEAAKDALAAVAAAAQTAGAGGSSGTPSARSQLPGGGSPGSAP